MKNLFKSLLGLIVLTATLAPQADAQLVTYQFTGTLIDGTPGIGNTIAGSVTLDVGAAPDAVDNESSAGESGYWSNGDFSINGVTDTGVEAGTSFGGWTSFNNWDYLYDPATGNAIPFTGNSISYFNEVGTQRFISLGGSSTSNSGDGFTSVPNPWDPLADDEKYLSISFYDPSTGISEAGKFTLDEFVLTPTTTTLIINGRDTGIDDFEYEGKLVSQYLEEFAASAKNQGGYVSSVAKLTNDLKKAGLLTKEQEKVMKSSANQSSIGKK